MSDRRAFAGLLLSAALAVSATAASAQQIYQMSGKFARSNGAFVNIPQVGDSTGNCASIVHGLRTTITVTPATKTPTKVAKTQIANPQGCVAGMAKITTITGMGAVGAPFYLPPQAFKQMAPGMTRVMSVPRVANIVQLATSFSLIAPPMTVGMGADAPMGTMLSFTTMGAPANLARFRYFHKSAWKTQTGRAGSMFTWCIGTSFCTNINQGFVPLIVKYNAGPNRFGGTMSHVITSGANPSSLALAGFFGSPNTVRFAPLVGAYAAQPTGRGYADGLHDYIMLDPIGWLMHMTGPVMNASLMTTQNLITSLKSPNMLPFSVNLVNYNYGFPLTTGTVLVRNTGTTGLGSPLVVTLTAKGKDTLTAMGARNISLVAGAVAATNAGTDTPTLVQIAMPEPTRAMQFAIGAIALLGIALWRSRTLRSVSRTRI